MTADFKSHVLRRDEKGFAGIPFKRLLISGVSGGLIYTLTRILMPGLALPSGIGVAVLTLILTGMRGGLPLWRRLWLRLRGTILLRAAQHTLLAELARLLNLPLGLAQIDGSALFAPSQAVGIDLREWVTFAQAREADHDDGLVFVTAPSEVLPR
jgi:hypothetical protein